MSNILTITPKSQRFKYNGFDITVVFNPTTKKWDYHASKPVTTTVDFRGDAVTLNHAASMAKRKVDMSNDKTSRVSK